MRECNKREKENNWIMSLNMEWRTIIWLLLCWVPAVLILCIWVLNVGQWKHPVKIWLILQVIIPAHLQIRQIIQLACCQSGKKKKKKPSTWASSSAHNPNRLSFLDLPAALVRIWWKEASVLPPSSLLLLEQLPGNRGGVWTSEGHQGQRCSTSRGAHFLSSSNKASCCPTGASHPTTHNLGNLA